MIRSKGKIKWTRPELLEAVKKGQTEVVKELLQKDPSLASTVDTDGVSALMKSVYYRKTDITSLLLSAGIDLNIFEAAATGEINRLKTLLAADQGWPPHTQRMVSPRWDLLPS